MYIIINKDIFHFLQFLNKILEQDVPTYKLKTDIMDGNVECLQKINLCFSLFKRQGSHL